MKIVASLGLAALLCSCSPSESEMAVRAYEVVDRSTMPSLQREETCIAAGRVKDAYLKEGNSDRYDHWSIVEYAACARASR